jgi:hypothetical protein
MPVDDGPPDIYAAFIPNPAWRLVWTLSTLKGEEDNILVDGFMDRVAEPTAAEMEILAAIPFEEEEIRANFGIPQFIRGLTGVEALKKHLYEPTCTICGLKSGYIGEGKDGVAQHGHVKLDFRLVPSLEPELVVDLLRQHLVKRGFADIEVVPLTGHYCSTTPADLPIAPQKVRTSI